jgi:hypothetical protein
MAEEPGGRGDGTGQAQGEAAALPDFYLASVKEMGAAQVAKTLGVNIAQVYLVKHRVTNLIREEVRRLEAGMEQDTKTKPPKKAP